jgi:hypothetical protein
MESTTGPVGDAVPSPSPPATALHADRRPDPGSQYLGALRELQEREREVLRIVATIQRAAKDLEHWQAVHVVRTGAGFPKEVTMAGRTIDGSTWPTGRQLADTLAAWHDTAENVRTAWARLPKETRSSLPPPP